VAAVQWEVSRIWEGETCAVLASGPSMSREVAEAVRGKCRVIAVSNQAIPMLIDGEMHSALAPWADVLIASDRQWWIENREQALAFTGLKVTVEPPGGCERLGWNDVMQLKNGGAVLYDERPDHVGGGGNTGFHAVHLAAKFGCRKILLCGFDMQSVAGSEADSDPRKPRARQHWFGEHPWRPRLRIPFDLFVERFTRSAPEFEKRGIRVINCTPGSALKCFPFMTIEEALAC
jgi:hypothetical protein